ncbi:unnamed protein product, partial [Candidula unifasciata]
SNLDNYIDKCVTDRGWSGDEGCDESVVIVSDRLSSASEFSLKTAKPLFLTPLPPSTSVCLSESVSLSICVRELQSPTVRA